MQLLTETVPMARIKPGRPLPSPRGRAERLAEALRDGAARRPTGNPVSGDTGLPTCWAAPIAIALPRASAADAFSRAGMAQAVGDGPTSTIGMDRNA